jgi:hypothetical protein
MTTFEQEEIQNLKEIIQRQKKIMDLSRTENDLLNQKVKKLNQENEKLKEGQLKEELIEEIKLKNEELKKIKIEKEDLEKMILKKSQYYKIKINKLTEENTKNTHEITRLKKLIEGQAKVFTGYLTEQKESSSNNNNKVEDCYEFLIDLFSNEKDSKFKYLQSISKGTKILESILEFQEVDLEYFYF